MSGLTREELRRLSEAIERVTGRHISVEDDTAEDQIAELIADDVSVGQLDEVLRQVNIEERADEDLLRLTQAPPPKPGRAFATGVITKHLDDEPTSAADMAGSGGVAVVPYGQPIAEAVAACGSWSPAVVYTFLSEAERARRNIDRASIMLSDQVYTTFSSRLRAAVDLIVDSSLRQRNAGVVEIKVLESADRPTFVIAVGGTTLHVDSPEKIVDATKANDGSVLYWKELLDTARDKFSEATIAMSACLPSAAKDDGL